MPFPHLPPSIAAALQKREYAEPTPVQSAVLAADAGRDLLVSAQTGSGKTIAYGLAIAPALLNGEERLPRAGAPLALVVAPTRELAMQVHRELEWLFAAAGGRVVACVGGMDARREQRELNAGCHIVVGTPGRLRDHLERNRLDATHMQAVVLDEADEMLDLGFREDIEFILSTTPAERRTLLFSATIPKAIAQLATNFQRNSQRLDVASANVAHADIEYRAIRIAPNDGERAVVNVLRFFEARTAIVFCATREGVRHMHASLTERGFSVVALSGELSQNERNHGLQALRDGRARVCIATDVAARGLDLPDLSLVIHADLPNNRDTLLHRSGRTGRAGRKGVCILIVPVNRRRRAEALLMAAKVQCKWSGPPTAEEVGAKDEARILSDEVFTEVAGEEDLDLIAKLQERYTPDVLAAALAQLLREKLPAPEEIEDPAMGRDDRAPPRANQREPNARESNMREPRSRDTNPREPSAREGRPYEPHNPQGQSFLWFKLNLGRQHDADPRWLVPLICRHGRLSKAEIGSIKIQDRETFFEIDSQFGESFAASLKRVNDKNIKIVPASAPPDAGSRSAHRKGGYEGPKREGGFKRDHAPRPEGAAGDRKLRKKDKKRNETTP